MTSFDTYIEISSSVPYLRIIDLPVVPVFTFSLPSSFILVVAPSFQSQPVVQYLDLEGVIPLCGKIIYLL